MSGSRTGLIEALMAHGVVGVDEDELLDGLGAVSGDERYDELRALREVGNVEGCGCSWVRMSRAWWSAEIQRVHGVSRARADAIVEALAGSAS